MGRLARGYGLVVVGLAVAAGLILAAIVVAILFDVVVRNLGFQPPAHTLTLAEYGLYYATLLGAPWLLREKGHVYVELVTSAVGPRLRRLLERAVYLLCIAVCAVMVWYGIDATLTHFARGTTNVRSFDMPRWLLFACLPLSFALMGIEFVRFMAGIDTMYGDRPDIGERF